MCALAGLLMTVPASSATPGYTYREAMLRIAQHFGTFLLPVTSPPNTVYPSLVLKP
jgi:hypothetical protein